MRGVDAMAEGDYDRSERQTSGQKILLILLGSVAGTCGFQSLSYRMQVSAVCRFTPSPPARVLRM